MTVNHKWLEHIMSQPNKGIINNKSTSLYEDQASWFIG